MEQGTTGATFGALGTTALVCVSSSSQLGPARAAVQETVADFDRACSRFREDSELCALNASSGKRVPAGGLLMEAVSAALRAAQLTEGDVDPTVGEALVAIGYDRDFESLVDRDSDQRSAAARPIRMASLPGWRAVHLDRERDTIQLPPGVKMDLGATAKALAADRAAAAAHAATGCGVLVSLGGDIALAGPSPQAGWRVRVTDDHRSGVDAPGQWISLRSGALATSSTTTRRWRTENGWAHHLVDPASGRPVRSMWRTVSVCAASCLDANTASTAAIIRCERAPGWLESLGLPSRLVEVDGTVHHVAGWPAEGDDLQ